MGGKYDIADKMAKVRDYRAMEEPKRRTRVKSAAFVPPPRKTLPPVEDEGDFVEPQPLPASSSPPSPAGNGPNFSSREDVDALVGLVDGVERLRHPALGDLEVFRSAKFKYVTCHVPIHLLSLEHNYRLQEPSQKEIDAMADSIRQWSQFDPILICPLFGEGKSFEIMAGFTRVRAAFQLGLATLQAKLYLNVESDLDKECIRLLSNNNRKDPDYISEAREIVQVLGRYMGEQPGRTQKQFLEDVPLKKKGVEGEVAVTEYDLSVMKRVLRLPEEIKGLIVGGLVSKSHAELLSRVVPESESGSDSDEETLPEYDLWFINRMCKEIVAGRMPIKALRKRLKDHQDAEGGGEPPPQKVFDSVEIDNMRKAAYKVFRLENIKERHSQRDIAVHLSFRTRKDVEDFLASHKLA